MAIRTPGLPVTVIQVVAHSHPRLLVVATLARQSIHTPGLPVIQAMLTRTLAFLLSPPWPGTAFAHQGFQSFKLSLTPTLAFLQSPPWPAVCFRGHLTHRYLNRVVHLIYPRGRAQGEKRAPDALGCVSSRFGSRSAAEGVFPRPFLGGPGPPSPWPPAVFSLWVAITLTCLPYVGLELHLGQGGLTTIIDSC